MKRVYSCEGSIRGACGHRHLTVATALGCCRRDMAGCKSQGGYSDRSVRVYQNGQRVEPDREELNELLYGDQD